MNVIVQEWMPQKEIFVFYFSVSLRAMDAREQLLIIVI